MSSEDEFDQQEPPDSARDERIQSPHDRLINQTLQQIEAARTLVANHLPSEITEHLKLQTLSQVDTSFIDPNLRRRFDAAKIRKGSGVGAGSSRVVWDACSISDASASYEFTRYDPSLRHVG